MATCFHTLTAFPGIWSERSYDRYKPLPYKKAKSSHFKEFLTRHPALQKDIKPIDKDAAWAFLERSRNIETRTLPEKDFVKTDRKLSQRYLICIDPKSRYAGNIYNDDTRKVLAYKFFMIILGRPFHFIAKLVYHISLAALIVAIVQGVKKNETAADVGQRVFRSLMGIVRTPIYEVVLLIVALVALIVAPFKTALLYDFRAFTGKLSHEFYWGRRHEMLVDLNPCMRRVGNIMDFEKTEQKPKTQTNGQQEWQVAYEDTSDPVLTALDNKL